MVEFFRKIGRGLLLIVIAPFAIVFFAFYSLYAIFLFIVLLAIAIPKYLKGGSIMDATELDKRAAAKMAEQLMRENTPAQPQQQPAPTLIFNQYTSYTGNPNQQSVPTIDPNQFSSLINQQQQIPFQPIVKNVDYTEEKVQNNDDQ